MHWSIYSSWTSLRTSICSIFLRVSSICDESSSYTSATLSFLVSEAWTIAAYWSTVLSTFERSNLWRRSVIQRGICRGFTSSELSPKLERLKLLTMLSSERMLSNQLRPYLFDWTSSASLFFLLICCMRTLTSFLNSLYLSYSQLSRSFTFIVSSSW